ncbi:NAD(P)/FAD-dependent oxidoreductase [Brevibacterium album]|uniref:NAD(P)/FAD-dependent oxidoreductase n=1 Tax=Brevibacterium album TaxID=417948 RepID=UPI00041C78BF|nr:FAD-binding oxidoreductase [Brevibacterium album]
MKICVIGAGVLGLGIACELSAAGHAVTVVERERPFAGASRRSFAWINANNKFPSSYHSINAEGIRAHAQLQERLAHTRSEDGETWFHVSGGILADFGGERTATYAKRIADAEAEGYPVRRVAAAELRELEPAIAWPEDLDEALLHPSEGYLDNDVLGEVLQAALAQRGVEIRTAEAVRVESGTAAGDSAAGGGTDGAADGVGGAAGLAGGARVHFSDGSSEAFDRIVVAAGAASRELAAASGLSIPMADLSTASERTHSLLGLTQPADVDLRHVFISDRINVRPRHDGRLWVQVPRVEARVAEGESPELLAEVSAVMEEELERLFGVRVPMETVIFSGRSFPEDGLSIIGFLDEAETVYCAVTHSGMTLAALFAQLTAQELAGEESALLADFRPSRFTEGRTAGGRSTSADDAYFIGKQ